MIITGKTKSGFKFTVESKRLGDIRFIEALTSYDEASDKLTQLKSANELRKIMLGKDEKKLLDHIHDLHGDEDLIPMDEVTNTLIEIIQIMKEKSGEVKNS